MLSALNVRMLYLFAYHGLDNMSQRQVLVVLSIYVLVHYHYIAANIIL